MYNLHRYPHKLNSQNEDESDNRNNPTLSENTIHLLLTLLLKVERPYMGHLSSNFSFSNCVIGIKPPFLE